MCNVLGVCAVCKKEDKGERETEGQKGCNAVRSHTINCLFT